MQKLLNLGCGPRFSERPEWVNMDFTSAHPSVRAHDLRRGVPFPANTFDAVYHSHVLEHFSRRDAVPFVRECFRVLRPGGVLRVAVPDLEQICRLYLDALEGARERRPGSAEARDWMVVEMYDQAVRTRPGGEMPRHLDSADPATREFIISRIGNVGRELVGETGSANETGSAAEPVWRKAARRLKRVPGRLRRLAASGLLSEREREALALGTFRLSGEVHQWMYDEHSLTSLLRDAGFADVRRRSASESAVAGWGAYHLDVDEDGFEHAPSSLYVEGVRP
jgi:hypothetical protein